MTERERILHDRIEYLEDLLGVAWDELRYLRRVHDIVIDAVEQFVDVADRRESS